MGEWKYGTGKEQTYYDLASLGNSPEPEDVNMVIGNDSWTDLRCDECNAHVEEVMRVGDEPDYESATAHICKPCLVKALGEIK